MRKQTTGGALPKCRMDSFPQIVWRSNFALRSFTLAACCVLALISTGRGQPVDSLKVMTYNILLGGAQYGPLSRTVGVIQAAQADVIGIQEVGSSAQSIANALGFYYQGFNSDIAIISRYPVAEVFNQGVRLQVSPTQD